MDREEHINYTYVVVVFKVSSVEKNRTAWLYDACPVLAGKLYRN